MNITWLGHEGFRIESAKGVIILIDPWLDHPLATNTVRSLDRADLILLTHGHRDHIGSLEPLARKTGAKIVCIHDIYLHLSAKGWKNEIIGMNKGGSIVSGGIRITMVHADHSSSIKEGDALLPGGECVGYIVKLENGYTIYHSGDTNVFGDMAIIRELYAPELALLPIGDRYVMGPREAAYAVKLIRPSRIIPTHYATFPALTGTVDDFVAALNPEDRGKVTPLEIGQEIDL
ncbi:MAG: metal-dependent hydrolase [Nitrospirae bacterium]|nr:metal-dependent hydrolase [Nitrospirota bacterium]